MTPETLEGLVRDARPSALAAAVAELTEAERRKLSTFAWKLWRALDKQYWDTDFLAPPDGLVTRMLGRGRDRVTGDVHTTAMLAVVAVCPESRLRSLGGHLSGGFEHAFEKILADRRPEWIDDFIARQLDSENRLIGWTMLRRFIKDGICTKPTVDGYVQLMTVAIPHDINRPRTRRAISDLLREDPDLLEDEVWRLFRVETMAFTYDWEGPDGEDESWKSALEKLTGEGLLDRARMLDECLEGLSAGFKNSMLSAFTKLFGLLKPAPEEILARQATFIDLLSSGASHVLTFALKHLKTIDKKDRLDDDAFLAAIGRAFDVRTKTQPKAALALIQRAVKRDAGRTGDGVRLAIRALGHPSPDIQEKALDLLDAWIDAVDEKAIPTLVDRTDDVVPTHHGRLDAIVARIRGGATRGAPEDEGSSVDPAGSAGAIEALRDRAAAIPADLRALAGVDAALDDLDAPPSDAGAVPPPLPAVDALAVPVLADRDPIVPITSVDELIESVAHAVESVDSGEEIERILDGLSRIGTEKPDDFERLTAPLHRRIAGGQTGEDARGFVTSWGGPAETGVLLELWITGRRRRLEGLFGSGNTYRPPLTPMIEFTRRRIVELIDRLARGESAPLLAAPTHRGGWIDPRVLVARLAELEAGGLDVPPVDFTQALLRLAPDARAEALRAAEALGGDGGRIVRFALGGNETPERRDRKQRALWLAAGRARSPEGELDDLRALKIEADLPDAIVPATFRWRAHVVEQRDHRNRSYKTYKLDLDPDPPMRKVEDVAAMPTVAFHMPPERFATFGLHNAWLTQWVAMSWPLDLDPFFAMGARSLAARVDMQGSSFEPNFPYVEPLLDGERPWTEMACLTLWLGLLGRDADARGLAIDALIECIQGGRADPPLLGDVLARLASENWVKLNRVAEGLAEVGRVSALHAWTVCVILEHLIAALETLPRDAHHVLSLLRDLSTELERPVGEAAQRPLGGRKGASKTVKLARDLLGLSFAGPSPVLAVARRQAAAARIERAERWATGSRCPGSSIPR